MTKTETQNNEFKQEKVNEVWQGEWASAVASEDIFKNQLFIEAWRVFEKYVPKDAKNVLEAGGGSGRFGLKIAREFPNSEVAIIDIVDSSVNLIKKTAEKFGLLNVSVSKNDIFNLPFPDNKLIWLFQTQ